MRARLALFYRRVPPLVVHTLSRLLQHSMAVGGTLALGALANVFIGRVACSHPLHPERIRAVEMPTFRIPPSAADRR